MRSLGIVWSSMNLATGDVAICYDIMAHQISRVKCARVSVDNPFGSRRPGDALEWWRDHRPVPSVTRRRYAEHAPDRLDPQPQGEGQEGGGGPAATRVAPLYFPRGQRVVVFVFQAKNAEQKLEEDGQGAENARRRIRRNWPRSWKTRSSISRRSGGISRSPHR